MAKSKAVGGMTKKQLGQALGGVGVAFGALSVLAPRAVAGGYGVPVTPAGLQLQRLFGSRALVVSVLALTAKTDEEVDRGPAAGAAMNTLDAVTALASARGAKATTTMRAVLSSLAYGWAAWAVRAKKK